MTAADDCIFCAIVAGKIPSHDVYEDDDVKVFMDAFPASDGHTLVIPKRHAHTVFDIDDEDIRCVASMVRRVAIAMNASIAPQGITVSQANGEAAGQSVPHYHVHLMPRTAGERLRAHGSVQGDAKSLAAMAERIRDAMTSS